MEYVGYMGTLGNIAFSLIRNINTAYEEHQKDMENRFLANWKSLIPPDGDLQPEAQMVVDGLPVPGREPPSETKARK